VINVEFFWTGITYTAAWTFQKRTEKIHITDEPSAVFFELLLSLSDKD